MERYTFFYRTPSPFSQWHPTRFIIEGLTFNSAEQYMMYKKAVLFHDLEMSQRILNAKTPREQKEFGRLVKDFEKEKWDRHCKQFVYDANYAKFTQNQGLLEILLETRGTTLVEASPTDRIWGVGLLEDDPKIKNRKSWLGKNWLGEILTQLREDILRENEKNNME
ncbi:NADAR family protein [Paenibacillus sp. SYP-B3998]|uniref:NADAR family protein n=1 Tax=Paenibacillus sp. SYP-B3998 TaxID=2678564 RepID=A0A6G3ZW95_9BACL|nr:NADAR family protein [Paenibacillus sp. SYP-B3998]NEW06402.1 NADAR family protein [Paenibacillus sp. SYP-B3998]